MIDVVSFRPYTVDSLNLTKFLFFTGKGGVGKTSIACATAVNLADKGNKVLLVSTDPASNLQDVFETTLTNDEIEISKVKNLWVANLDPVVAAEEYKKSVIEPYIGKLPEVVIANMEEQLSGSCTVEIASFNEFTKYLADPSKNSEYDYIVFDTAPTGHTLRLLQLPSAWDSFISESTHGASCLGQLSGLEGNEQKYADAVACLSDSKKTTVVLVSKPEEAPLIEASRASQELKELNISNQILVINGVIENLSDDVVELGLFNKQQKSLRNMPKSLLKLEVFKVPLRSYNITGIRSIRELLIKDNIVDGEEYSDVTTLRIDDIVNDLISSNKRIVFTMGKGGVGKTTLACAIALGLTIKGKRVHLTTTDPANHIKGFINDSNITMSEIDEKKELLKYQEEVLSKARITMNEDDLDYIKEDLRSPCTQEIAVFRAFADIVARSQDEIVVIDTAPTGHTLLLLDSTKNYSREIQRSQGDIPDSVRDLLPKLKNHNETEVIIITLPEATPFFEAKRLKEDLDRAEINCNWWVVNSSFVNVVTESKLLKSKAQQEVKWINKINEYSNGKIVVIPWVAETIDEFVLRSWNAEGGNYVI